MVLSNPILTVLITPIGVLEGLYVGENYTSYGLQGILNLQVYVADLGV